MRRTGLSIAAGALLSLFSFAHPAEAANCPAGSYPSIDTFGNRVCQSFAPGGAPPSGGTHQQCPVGTHPWLDSWGNRVCKSFDDGRQLYDTSKGCPTGTYLWRDPQGNPTCKSF